ncbi:MAG: hypothetical protein J3R72DRAFT_437365 [Linnemannia gamsii]|nr:MAG: hypothetical protein J3R72DRAFT_437365 [Linnemannia gamsii]
MSTVNRRVVLFLLLRKNFRKADPWLHLLRRRPLLPACHQHRRYYTQMVAPCSGSRRGDYLHHLHLKSLVQQGRWRIRLLRAEPGRCILQFHHGSTLLLQSKKVPSNSRGPGHEAVTILDLLRHPPSRRSQSGFSIPTAATTATALLYRRWQFDRRTVCHDRTLPTYH